MRCNRSIVHGFCIVLMLGATWWGMASAPAQEASTNRAAPPEQVSGSEPLRFRRVYVPEDDVAHWPRPQVRYLPVEPKEFERLVVAAGANPEGSELPHGAQLVRAHYSAELKHDSVLEGTARLEFAHSSDAPVLVPLVPFGLSLDRAVWVNSDRAPILGLGPNGRLRILVEESGELELHFLVQGHRDSTGVLQFLFDLPESGQSSLDLTIPGNVFPTFSQGVLLEDPPESEGFRTWHAVLGSQHHVDVHLTPIDPTSEVRRRPLVKARTSYRYSERGIDMTCEMRLDVPYDPIRRVRIAIDQGLQLLAVHDENQPLRWYVGADNGSGRNIGVIELAEPFQGTGKVVRLEAMAPLTLDHLHVLPRLVHQDLAWQEGTISLVVPAPLQLTQFSPQLCRQTKIEPLPSPLSGESLEMQCFSSVATAQVAVSRRHEPMLLSTGTLVELGEGELTARLVGRCQSAGSGRFSMTAQVPLDWMIDSVETVPREVLDTWSLGPVEGTTRKLNIRFAHPLAADQPMQFMITARGRSTSLERPLGPEDLRVATFEETRLEDELVALQAQGPNKILLTTDDDLTRIPVSSLTDAQRKLFDESTLPEMVLRLDPRTSRWRATLERQAPEFSAQVSVQAIATDYKLLESYELRCLPGPTPLERLVVHFTQARTEAPRWSLIGYSRGEFLARKLSEQEQTALGGGPEGETWEILFKQPRGEPFVIRASRSAPQLGNLPVSLAALPEAEEQEGRLVIGADGGLPLAIHNERLRPAASTPRTPGTIDTTRAVFHYDPARETNRSKPAITLELMSTDAEPNSAFVWNRSLDSRCEPSGRNLHWLSLHLQSMGRQQFSLQLPEEAEILGLWVDHVPMVPLPSDHHIQIDLPPKRKYPVVVAQFATHRAPWSGVTSFTPPQVTVDLPVLADRRRVWLPPGYEPLSTGGGTWKNSLQPPLTWSQRLFGPLGRDATHTPFDPRKSDEWLRLVGQSVADAEARELVKQFLEQFSQALSESGEASETPLTWSEALQRCHLRLGEQSVPLRVDRVALAEIGIWGTDVLPRAPHSKIQDDPISADSATRRGLECLQASGLVLLVDNNTLLITSAAAAALERWQLTAFGAPAAYRVLPGPLSDRLASSLADDAARFVTLPGWQVEPPGPWRTLTEVADEMTSHLGWTVCLLEGPAQEKVPPLCVVRQSSIRVGAWAMLFGVLVMGTWLGRSRPQWLLSAAAGLAVLAMLLPASVVPLAGGALMGSLICLIIRWMPIERRTTRRKPSTSGSSPTLSLPAEAIGLLLLLAGLVACGNCFGQGLAETPQDAAGLPPAAWVFIPSDKQGKPTGARYQVPADFDAELRRRAAAAEGRAAGWLITKAAYQVILVRDAAQTGLDVAGLTASYDLQVLDKGVTVRIPWRLEEAQVVPDTATLDGHSLELNWDAETQALVCTVPEPGHWRLEFSIRPVLKIIDNQVGLDVHVPRMPQATLRMHLPPEAPTPEVHSAICLHDWSADRQVMMTPLGPTDRLSLRWPAGTLARNGAFAAEVDQLLWLKVGPGSVMLDARLKLHVPSGQISELRLVTDPRLRRLPLVNSEVPLAEIRSEPGDPRVLGDARVQTLRFSEPVSGDVTVQLSYLLTGSTGVGNVRLPRLEILGLVSSRRWMATSVDPALEYHDETGTRVDPVSALDFLAAWGPLTSPPQLAYDIPEGEVHWILSTKVREPQTTARQNLRISYFPGGADVLFEAQIKTRDGYTFQHQLTAPNDLEITNISLLEDGVQRVARWSHPERGPITVFLSAPVTGTQRLLLRGTVRTPTEGTVSLPLVRLDGANFAGSRVTVERQAGVLVSVVNSRQLIEQEEPDNIAPARPPRSVVMFTVESEAPSAQVFVKPNRPEVSVVQLSSLKREGPQWYAELETAWTVSGGVLDVLRFEVPPQWTGPFVMTPPVASEVIDIPGQSRRQLVIYPRTAIDQSYRLTIRGPLTLGSTDPVSVPNVIPLGAQHRERFYRLPSQLGTQHYDWETMYLRSAPLPEGFASPAVADSGETYHAVGPAPLARLRSLDRVSTQPQVAMSDVQIAWQGSENYEGIATFDLDPADLEFCTLAVPGECQLVQTYVDGSLTTPLPGDGDEWHVPLRLRQLPQRVEVIFTGRLSPESRGRLASRLEAPVLKIPPDPKTTAEETLRPGTSPSSTFWTIYGPPDSSPVLEGDAHNLTPVRYELTRLRTMTNLMNLSADDLAAVEPDEVGLWYRGWRRRWETTRDALRRYLLSMPQTTQTLSYIDEVAQLERELASIADRLALVPVVEGDSARLADQPRELWAASIGTLRPTARLQVSGSSGSVGSVPVRVPELLVSDFVMRLAWVVLAVAAIVGLIAARVRGHLTLEDSMVRWPAVWGIVLGLAWWLWLVPSVLGLMIVAVSVVIGLRNGFQRVREPRAAKPRLGTEGS